MENSKLELFEEIQGKVHCPHCRNEIEMSVLHSEEEAFFAAAKERKQIDETLDKYTQVMNEM